MRHRRADGSHRVGHIFWHLCVMTLVAFAVTGLAVSWVFTDEFEPVARVWVSLGLTYTAWQVPPLLRAMWLAYLDWRDYPELR